ncbi:nitronate monooxygenase [Fodinisporobacter ferrooxydans]|uniref:Probable nitronate monooxygenase n=1 Tax=Fodinisporobacter ferrooxydans TaxID=2901836 RepID=A0ABY4CNE4_9BACL|nr:nitronate monooxygenase [Alicyclobacillaceae bacterium MYW30-H2]
MWPHTKLTELLGIKYPIIQAGMAGGSTTPELVAAVSNAGGLGTLGAGYMAPEQMRKAIADIRERTDQPFGVNLFVPGAYEEDMQVIFQMQEYLKGIETRLGIQSTSNRKPGIYAESFAEQLSVILEENVPVFSFTFGIPDAAAIEALHSNQTKVIGTATTVKEALLLAERGVDAIVAQGSEAGGHRGTFLQSFESSLVGTMALVPQIADRVRLPVIASGGIMDGRGIVASLALGAAGVQMGTAFLSSFESGAHSKYKERILTSSDDSTVITRAFSGKPARGIKNEFITMMDTYGKKIPHYPIQNALTKEMRKAAAGQENTEYMSLWAGQAASLSQLASVEELMSRLIRGVTDTLHSIQE